MQVNSFYAVAENGVIHLPEKYKTSINFKIIVLEEEPPSDSETQILLEEIKQLRGIISPDIDEKSTNFS